MDTASAKAVSNWDNRAVHVLKRGPVYFFLLFLLFQQTARGSHAPGARDSVVTLTDPAWKGAVVHFHEELVSGQQVIRIEAPNAVAIEIVLHDGYDKPVKTVFSGKLMTREWIVYGGLNGLEEGQYYFVTTISGESHSYPFAHGEVRVINDAGQVSLK